MLPTEATINKVTGIGSSGTTTRTISVDEETAIAYLNLPDYQDGGYQNIISLAADFSVGKSRCGAEGTATVNIPLGYTFTLGNADNSSLPNLTGSGAFVKTGTGTVSTVVFGGALGSGWTGTMDIQQGAFTCGWASSLGNPSMVTIESGAMFNSLGSLGQLVVLNGSGINDQGALYFTGTCTSSAGLNFATLSVINVPTAGWEATVGDPLSGGGGFKKIGLGKLILGGSGTTGDVEVAQGVLQIVGSITGNVLVRNGATLKGTQAQIDGTVTVEEGGIWDQTVAAAWDGNGDPNNSGDWSDPLNWTGNQLPTEATIPGVTGSPKTRVITVDQDTELALLNLQESSASGCVNRIALAANLTVSMVNIGSEGIAEIAVAGGTTLTLGATQAFKLPVVTGSGDVVKTGSSAMTMYAFAGSLGSNWTGRILVDEGTFDIGAYCSIGSTSLLRVADGAMVTVGANWPNATGQSISLNGSGIASQGALKFTMGGQWSTNSGLDFATACVINVATAGAEVTVSGPLSGSGGFTKIGPGTLILGGSGSTGGIDVSQGLLQLIGSITGDVIVRSGATLKATQAQIDGVVTVEEGGTWDQTVAASWDGDGDPNNSGNWNDAPNWSGNQVPTEATINNVTGVGSSGTNTRTITIDQPTSIAYLNLPDYQPGPYQNIISLAADFTVAKAFCGAQGTATVNIPEGFTFTLGNDQTSQLPGLSGPGAFVKTGSGAVDVVGFGGSPSGSWTGTMEVQQGTLQAGVFTSLGDPSMITVDAGAVLALNHGNVGRGITLNGTGIAGNGALRFSGGTDVAAPITLATSATVNVDTNTVNLTGTFAGPGNLTKIGLGRLSLANGTIAGNVLVDQGVLALNGSTIIDDGRSVFLAAAASLDIADGQNETVGALYFSGVMQSPGTWGRSGSGAANTNDTYFTGRSGILTVGSPTPTVTSFVVSDLSSGSTLMTNNASVRVAITADAPGGAITNWAITEVDAEPAEWSDTEPTSYTIAGAEGDVTLYAWVKDSAGMVGHAGAVIFYSTAIPVVSNVDCTGDDTTVTVTWQTDIKALGSLMYGPVNTTTAEKFETALGLAHSVTITGLVAGQNYKLVIVNNESPAVTIYYPKPWPIEGDANLDCRVNILDLIFIRNRLNQDPATGENWQADVNEDTRINILDLIYVRNRLNNACP